MKSFKSSNRPRCVTYIKSKKQIKKQRKKKERKGNDCLLWLFTMCALSRFSCFSPRCIHHLTHAHHITDPLFPEIPLHTQSSII